MNPFRRRRDTADSPVESALRTSLARHAFDTPDADDLTRRILASAAMSAAEDEPDRVAGTVTPLGSRSERGAWKTRGLPLVAAAAVVAVVGAGAAIASYDKDNGKGKSQQAATQGPSTPHATVAETHAVTSTPEQTRTATRQMRGTSGLMNVKIIDLTFYDQDEGIALASADCIKTSGRCTALLQTTNGTRWTAKGGSFGFDVPGVSGCPASRCVEHIRFARDDVGYAYGPDAFFMTTDGGSTWQQRSGGADALESLDDNVIRVSTNSTGCPPGCSYVVQTAAIGSPTWNTVPLPGGDPVGDGVQLSLGGTGQHDAYLLVTQNPAGGAGDEQSTLYRSSDNGSTWADAGEPCPQSSGEVDSYQVAAGSGDNVSVLCRARASGPYRLGVSTDSGAMFTMQTGTIAFADVSDNGDPSTGVLADSGTVRAVAGRGVSISRNDGASWRQAADLVGTFASVGFESTKVGRAVTADGTQIWTTRNAGKSWTESTP